MKKLQLKSAARDATTAAEKLRKQGMLPAVVYGHNVPAQAVAVNQSEFKKVLKQAGESTIIDLITPDGVAYPVLIQEVQSHYLTSQPIHADFYAVSMTEKLKASVALEFTGEAPAVKALGGVLMKALNSLEVECLPADLPHSLTVDISSLKDFSLALSAKDIAMPKGVKLITNPEEVVAKVQPPRDVESELAAPVVEDVSAVQGAAEEKPADAEPAEQEKS